MKVFLFFILWIHVCLSLRDRQASENYWRQVICIDKPEGNEDVIEHPCSLHDVNCIRRYFAANSNCSPTCGLTPDPYKMKTLPMHIPQANISFTLNNVTINGFNDWKINEFYINKKTDKLVLEVEFKRLIVNSDATVIKYFNKGKEPLEISDSTNIDYNSLSLTIAIPHIRHIDLSKADVFTYISDAAPCYALGQKFTECGEPRVRETVRKFQDALGLSVQEAFVTQGPVFMTVFVENIICDFNLQFLAI